MADISPFSNYDTEPKDPADVDEENLLVNLDWHERIERRKATCMFCPEKTQGVEPILKHMTLVHNINMLSVRYRLNMDDYAWIQLVNYTRRTCTTAGEIVRLIKVKERPWKDPVFYKPALQDDLLLQWEPDELAIKAMKEDSEGMNSYLSPLEQLQDRIRITEERAKLAEEALERAMTDLKSISACATSCWSQLSETQDQSAALILGEAAAIKKKNRMKKPLDEYDDVGDTSEEDEEGAAKGSDEEEDSEEEEYDSGFPRVEDDPYFQSYANVSIHREMLQDSVRTRAYRDFMYENRALFKGKIVLDVGCGTGILSMFAARAGAKLVYAVDRSEIVYQAMANVRENKLDEVIKVMNGQVEEVLLKSKVDVIISEWMGYFLLYESMFDSVIAAREKWLAPGGLVFPGKLTMNMIGLDDHIYIQQLDYWKNVYGFRMSSMRHFDLLEADVSTVDPDCVVTDPATFMTLDAQTATVENLQFKSDICIKVNRSCVMTALASYFDTHFATSPDQKEISFSCSPSAPATHWKQTVFILKDPITVHEGDTLEGEIQVEKQKNHKRALHVILKLKQMRNGEELSKIGQDYLIQ